MKLKLSPRLDAVLQEIGRVKTIADIGTDHGKLLVSAVFTQRAERGVGIDISRDSLKKAQRLAEEYGVAGNCRFFTGDGFSPLKERVDVAVIAGMGGHEAVHILKQGDAADRYILVPHQDACVLRRFLGGNGYCVLADYVVKDRKYYDIIVAERGRGNYSEREIYLGKNHPPSDFFAERNTFRKELIGKIIKESDKSMRKDALDDNIREEWRWLDV